jgi:hypothetical protein
MSFGLTDAPAIFMDTMNRVFHDHLDPLIVVFIDDTLIYSKNQEDQVLHLRRTLDRL